MFKWLRSWFAWRFSVARLVVAVVFLGSVVGLNVSEIGPTEWPDEWSGVGNYRGWPLPFIKNEAMPSGTVPMQADFDKPEDQRTESEKASIEDFWTRYDAMWASAYSYQLPWTHRSYRLIERCPQLLHRNGRIVCGAIDALFAFIPLALILFFHPRHKPPDKAPA